MRTGSPSQLLAVGVLVLACLQIILQPVGLKPKKQSFDIRYPITGDIDKLVKGRKPDDKQSPQDIADEAVARAADAIATVKTREIVVNAEARHRQEAQRIAQRVTAALRAKFDGIENPIGYADKLRPAPVRVLGPLAIYRPQPHLKLGLDLQGGSHLVLQLRHTIFLYKFPKRQETPKEREVFAEAIRSQLQLTGLDAEVPSRKEKGDQLVIRTQAATRAQFEREKEVIHRLLAGEKYKGERLQAEFAEVTKDAQEQSVEIVRNRVDTLGVGEVQILKSGNDRVVVDLPGVKDPQEAQAAIKETAMLEFRLLPEKYKQDPNQERSEAFVRFVDNKGIPVSSATVFDDAGPLAKETVEGDRRLTGNDLMPTARAGRNQMDENTVNLQFKTRGTRVFGQVTSFNVGKYLAIFLDRDCISAPVIREPITAGRVEISGGFQDVKEAQRLAMLLNGGALPVPLDIVENRTISATLGADAVRKSVFAGLAGLALVVLFMIFWYGIPGILADFALMVYCVLNLAILILLDATVTLPGIAGFILSMAMSIDTNILVFERLKEELASDKTFRAAIQAAFDRAWTAIFDSHVTTLTAGFVLYYFGTGPVKGFAVTLAVGVLLSLFSAITVTRIFVNFTSHTILGNMVSLWRPLPSRVVRSTALIKSPVGS